MATILVVAAIALAVTPIFVVNAFRLLATDTFVRREIDRSGFPADRYGLTTAERRSLAPLMIEIRNDLIRERDQQSSWSNRLAPLLKEATTRL